MVDRAERSKWVSKDARRRDIVAAAIDSVARVGFADTTLATVAREAGMSQANLLFHFKSKDALLVETLRHVSAEFAETWQSALAKAGTDPLARLLALVGASFSPKVCNRKSIAVWHAFYGEAKSRPQYLKICGANDHERYEATTQACRDLLLAEGKPPDGASDMARMIEGLIDGLWVDILISPDMANRFEAQRIVLLQLRILVPDRAADIDAWEAANARRRAPAP
ncbi:TetR family transcriptional regulator C-terminal domain-containing protein [Microbaculum marinum]|uniref:TetR family transcriptional regulator C-terminal domain-containing protein n=1 Tax=Microbaculum marinum TaxID=1764581 RepID=A0AAW9RQW2_9HYPH